MANGTRIPIQRVESDGRVIDGTARMRGVTIDDFRSAAGTPLNLPPGASFVVCLDALSAEAVE